MYNGRKRRGAVPARFKPRHFALCRLGPRLARESWKTPGDTPRKEMSKSMENDPTPDRPGAAPPPAAPDGPTSFLTPSPAAAEKIATRKLRSFGNRSSGLLLSTQLLASAVLFAILVVRTVLLFRNSAGGPEELLRELSPTGDLMILYGYVATFWGMVLCLVVARSMLGQRVFAWWRRPRASSAFLGEGVVLMFGAVCAGEILAYAVTFLFGRFGISNGTPNFELKGNPTTDAVLIVYVCVLAPILEETLFRGMILQGLRPWGDRFAVAASALLFGVFHMNLVQGVAALCMGLALGLIAVRSGSVLPGIFVHALNNSISIVLLATGVNKNPAIAQGYAGFLFLCLLGTAALLYFRRADFALSDAQQPLAPPARHRWRALLLQSGWFWVLLAVFAATCVFLALSPQSAMFQKVS